MRHKARRFVLAEGTQTASSILISDWRLVNQGGRAVRCSAMVTMRVDDAGDQVILHGLVDHARTHSNEARTTSGRDRNSTGRLRPGASRRCRHALNETAYRQKRHEQRTNRKLQQQAEGQWLGGRRIGFWGGSGVVWAVSVGPAWLGRGCAWGSGNISRSPPMLGTPAAADSKLSPTIRRDEFQYIEARRRSRGMEALRGRFRSCSKHAECRLS